METKNKGFAITSLVLSLVGLFLFAVPMGILSIIFGGLGWKHGMGKAGVILGIIDVIAGIAILTM